MNSLTNEDWKQIKEIYSDTLISDILNNSEKDVKYFWGEKEIKKKQNYICLEDQFDYCLRKNITI